jgi:hypothetical protein
MRRPCRHRLGCVRRTGDVPLDANGTVVCKQIGPLDMDTWRSKFLPLISGEKKGPCT